jgi:hypothetical protein
LPFSASAPAAYLAVSDVITNRVTIWIGVFQLPPPA